VAGYHRHGREAFGASAGTSAVGDTAAAGTATTPSRSDHRHGRESFAVGATTTSNPGDGAADGTSTSPARADHRHGREAQALPAGSLLAGAWSAAPSGYLLCDGTAVSRSIYSALFAAIGVAWGAGDGSTTFNVPDLRGRTAVGANGPGGAGQPNWPLGTMSGSTSITEANMPAHNHTGTTGVDAPNHSHAAPGGGSGYIVNVSSTVGLQPGGSNPAANSGGPTAGVSNNHYHSIPTDGSGTAYSQPFAAVLYVIKT
jgi:microcystin-dependent protein